MGEYWLCATDPVGAGSDGSDGEAPGWAGGYPGTAVVVVGGIESRGAFWAAFSVVCGVAPAALAALIGLWE